MRLTDLELLDELKSRFDENTSSLKQMNELNLQLMELNRKLEESERMKSNFLSNIRNEIVNPFASILGLATHIQACGSDNIERIRQMAAMIYSEAFSLDFQLQNIFAAAEIEAGDLQPYFSVVDVEALFNSVFDSFNPELQKKGITLSLECSLGSYPFKGDAEGLSLIFANLLSNSIKFSHNGGKIDIRLALEDECLQVVFTDYGIGMDEGEQTIIFDRFKRVNSSINTLNSGNGLGLTVVQAVVDALNGTIAVVSRKGEGSTFRVSIPEAMSSDNVKGYTTDVNEIMFDFDNEIF